MSSAGASFLPVPSAPPAAGETAPRAVRRLRTHWLERSLVVVVSAHLALLAWAFGGVDLITQLASALLGAVALVLALLPRMRRAAAGAPSFPAAWSRLRRDPVFWAGLFLFGYVAIQGGNSAFVYRQAGTQWWLERQAHAAWLPAGMEVPFRTAGPWRALLLWFPPWAVVCALSLGVTRKSTATALLTVTVVNGFALAAFGLVQLAGRGMSIYGLRLAPSGDFFAGFIYKNHAAEYFNLLAIVAGGLAVRAYWQDRRRGGRNGPAILLFLFTVTLMLAVVATGSLSGVALLAGSLLVLGPLTLFRSIRSFPPRVSMGPGPLVAGLLVVVVGVSAAMATSTRLRYQVRVKLEGEAYQSAHMRLLAVREGLAMLEDRWLFGWGAGCFRYGFTKYQHRQPDLTGKGDTRFFWEHLHNDWLELPIEVGLAGLAAPVVAGACFVRRIVRQRLWRHPALTWPLAGLVVLGAGAAVDFPFQNPAVLVTAGAILVLMLRSAEAGAEAPASR